MTAEQRRALLVTSHGGHLIEMLQILPAFEDWHVTIVTYDDSTTQDLGSAFEGTVHRLPFSTGIFASRTSMLRHLIRLVRHAWRILGEERPDLVLSTGSEIALPFAYLARVRKTPFVFVESLSRPNGLSGTGRLVKPATSLFIVQWEELARNVKGTQFGGRVL